MAATVGKDVVERPIVGTRSRRPERRPVDEPCRGATWAPAQSGSRARRRARRRRGHSWSTAMSANSAATHREVSMTSRRAAACDRQLAARGHQMSHSSRMHSRAPRSAPHSRWLHSGHRTEPWPCLLWYVGEQARPAGHVGLQQLVHVGVLHEGAWASHAATTRQRHGQACSCSHRTRPNADTGVLPCGVSASPWRFSTGALAGAPSLSGLMRHHPSDERQPTSERGAGSTPCGGARRAFARSADGKAPSGSTCRSSCSKERSSAGCGSCCTVGGAGPRFVGTDTANDLSRGVTESQASLGGSLLARRSMLHPETSAMARIAVRPGLARHCAASAVEALTIAHPSPADGDGLPVSASFGYQRT